MERSASLTEHLNNVTDPRTGTITYRPSVDWLLLIDQDVRRPLRC